MIQELHGATYAWTPENIERLESLIGKKSYRHIAIDLFGTAKARCAVAGKVQRLEASQQFSHDTVDTLVAKRLMRQDRANREQMRSARNVRERVRKARNYVTHAYGHVPLPLPRPIIPPNPEFRCTLMELNSQRCHFPIGDPEDHEGFRYCGCPDVTMPGPYCAHCHALVYVPYTLQPAESLLDTEILL